MSGLAVGYVFGLLTVLIAALITEAIVG